MVLIDSIDPNHPSFIPEADVAAYIDEAILCYIFKDLNKTDYDAERCEAIVGDWADKHTKDPKWSPELVYNRLRKMVGKWKHLDPNVEIRKRFESIENLPKTQNFLNDKENKENPQWIQPKTSHEIVTSNWEYMAEELFGGPGGPQEKNEIEAAELLMNNEWRCIYGNPSKWGIGPEELEGKNKEEKESHIGGKITGHFIYVTIHSKDYQETKLGQVIEEFGGVKELARILVFGEK